jgi:hypothetical protein
MKLAFETLIRKHIITPSTQLKINTLITKHKAGRRVLKQDTDGMDTVAGELIDG